MTHIEDILPPPFAWCEVMAGKVKLKKGGYVREEGKVFEVKPFKIAKYPITNAQFQVFVDAADGYQQTAWWDYNEMAKRSRRQRKLETTAFAGDNHPRTNVSWYDAIAFCRWLSSKTQADLTLPTEQQWQRAAQGDDERIYPWGNTFDKSCCNTREIRLNHTTPVTQYEGLGDSPFGVVDMLGNVWEYCLTKYKSGGNKLDGDALVVRAMRGTSWLYEAAGVYRVDYRGHTHPFVGSNRSGFRIALID